MPLFEGAFLLFGICSGRRIKSQIAERAGMSERGLVFVLYQCRLALLQNSSNWRSYDYNRRRGALW